ncbi:recombinase family protein [Yasminevirus sp. GU-2018]|uniref:Recombinase family protein n=1 Tax=Yasminevirus sp. GU-2018 TaxID=2420051 RepID=A0A5K0U7V9_9VIRU|nr:recombinase family protein [Yasminevirus sp. GU-2018]
MPKRLRAEAEDPDYDPNNDQIMSDNVEDDKSSISGNDSDSACESSSTDQSDSKVDVEIEAILDYRVVKNRKDYLVKYSDGVKVGRRWVQASDLFNCDALIRNFWRVREEKERMTPPTTKTGTKSNSKGQYKNPVSITTKSSNVPDTHARPTSTTKSTSKRTRKFDEMDVQIEDPVQQLAVDVEACDPFSSNVTRSRKVDTYEDDEDVVVMPKAKKAKYVEGDNVAEIENILKTQKCDGINYYLIKWVGSKVPTWITQDDFYEHDALKEFWKYKTIRDNKALTRRAYIYCRTSRRNADREVSLNDQERYCLNFAKRNNINVIGVYRDNGVSAKNMNNQFSLNYICDNIQKGECILFYDVSRFSRSMSQALIRLDHLRNNIGAIAHSCHDGLTWNDVATNRASFRVNLSNAQLHSEVISEKVLSAIDYRRERGDHIGYVPYGFSTQMINGVRRLVPNKDERKVITAVLDTAIDVVGDRLGGMVISKGSTKGSKSKKAPKQKVKTAGMRRKLRDQVNDFTPTEYRKITSEVNANYSNRGGKPFTWKFIKGLILKWSDKPL